MLALHRRLRLRWPRLLLLWAPRHPERFRPVAYAAVQAGFRTATRQMTHQPDAADDVFVVDTLGELARFYGIRSQRLAAQLGFDLRATA